MDRQLTEDNFDDVAREAGDALRRPAPADGMAQIRRTRRRQQQVRAATGVAALVAIVAAGAFVATRNDDGPALVVEPDTTSTVAPTPTTEPAPTTTDAPAPTQAPTTSAAPVSVPSTSAPGGVDPTPFVGLSEEAAAWRDARIADGFTIIDIRPGDVTGARLLLAQGDQSGNVVAAVLLDDGRVIDAPAGAGIDAFSLYGVGGGPAMLDLGPDGSGNSMRIWVLDIDTEEWTQSAELGLGTLDYETATSILPFEALTVGDALLVVVDEYEDPGDGSLRSSPNRRGVIVGPDLSISPMAQSPDGVPMRFSIATGGRALAMFGPNLGFLSTPSFRQPWAYDPATDSWTEISLPDWFECSEDDGSCEWLESFDGGPTVQLDTGRGVLVGVPDGSVGLYDPTTDSWARADAPFTISGFWTAQVLGTDVVLANGRDATVGFGDIGVLDLETATWTSTRVDLPADVQEQIDTVLGDPQWDLRPVGDTRVIAAPGGLTGATFDPVAVYDATAGAWISPTAEDLEAWRSLATRLAG